LGSDSIWKDSNAAEPARTVPGTLSYDLSKYNPALKSAGGIADYTTYSDDKGYVSLEGLQAGWYVLQETSAPYVYATDLNFYLIHLTPAKAYGMDRVTIQQKGAQHIDTDAVNSCSGKDCNEQPPHKQFIDGSVDWQKLTNDSLIPHVVTCSAAALKGEAPCANEDRETAWPDAAPVKFDDVTYSESPSNTTTVSNSAAGYGTYSASGHRNNYAYLEDRMNSK
jgi:hypothetical protein